MPQPVRLNTLEAHALFPHEQLPQDPQDVGVAARVPYDPEPQSYSIQWQQQACREHAERQGWKVVETYQEIGRATPPPRMDRPLYAAILQDLDAGKIDGVLVVRPDRLFHSPEEFDQIMPEIERRGGFVVATNERLDSRNPTQRDKLRDRLAFPEQQRRLPQPRGNRRFGLTYDGQGTVPAEAAALRYAADRILRQGARYTTVLQELHDQGILSTRGRPISTPYLLKRILTADGVAEQGVLSQDDVNELRARPTAPHRRPTAAEQTLSRQAGGIDQVRLPLEGVVDCGSCDQPLRGVQRDGEARYECLTPTCQKVSIGQATLDAQVTARVAADLGQPGRIDQIMEAMASTPTVVRINQVIESQADWLAKVGRRNLAADPEKLQRARDAATERLGAVKEALNNYYLKQLGTDLNGWNGESRNWTQRQLQALSPERQRRVVAMATEKISVTSRDKHNHWREQVTVRARDWAAWAKDRTPWRTVARERSHNHGREQEHSYGR